MRRSFCRTSNASTSTRLPPRTGRRRRPNSWGCSPASARAGGAYKARIRVRGTGREVADFDSAGQWTDRASAFCDANSMNAARRTPLIASVPKMLFPVLVILPGMIAVAVALTGGTIGRVATKSSSNGLLDFLLPSFFLLMTANGFVLRTVIRESRSTEFAK